MKYELVLNDFITINKSSKQYPQRKLYRIRALRDIGSLDIKIGDLGGYVESYTNLSQNGDCWIFPKARAYENASVSDNAVLLDNSKAFENANLSGNVTVSGTSRIFGDSQLKDNVVVQGNCAIYSNAYLKGSVTISDNARIHGNVWLSGYVLIKDNVELYGCIGLSGKVCISGNASIQSPIDYLQFQVKKYSYPVVIYNDVITCAFFHGNYEDFKLELEKQDDLTCIKTAKEPDYWFNLMEKWLTRFK